MTTTADDRERIAYLRGLAIERLENYRGGFAGLQQVTTDLDSIISSLVDVADPSWANSLFRQWSELEIIYALKLDSGRHLLTAEEDLEVQGIVAGLLAAFRSHQVPLQPDDKPEEGDLVALRRGLPNYNLSAGASGVIVVDYSKYSEGDGPLEYEVEFAGHDAAGKVLTTLAADDLTILSRPRFG
jgi:Domain of unknown function (DUF4926)